jgi:predicted ATP-dependent serine protease
VKEAFNYQCQNCGHVWTWGYLFVIRCPKCKQYRGFRENLGLPTNPLSEKAKENQAKPAA